MADTKGTDVPETASRDICRAASPKKGPKFDRKRRLFIRAGIATAVGAAILAYGVSLLLKPGATIPGTAPAAPNAFFSQQVTPNPNFYRVDVDLLAPSVNGSTWNLGVTGLVDTPLKLNLEDLEQMSVVEQYNTLECVSNEVGGNLIGTAQWTGVRLMDVLNMAGVQSSAEYVVFNCVDGYSVGIPLDAATMEGALLAFEMNGVPLPQDHGYPLRAIVPGLYGMSNAKWITGIEVVKNTYLGYWQQRGWEEDAMYQTGSSIVIPGNEQVTSVFGISGSSSIPLGIVPIAGLAFAGDRGISKVEVSTDGGKTWTTASLMDPLSSFTWVFWFANWNPPSEGRYSLQVRATDGQGNLQAATMSAPFPNGATGYDIVDITVSAPTSQTSSSG